MTGGSDDSIALQHDLTSKLGRSLDPHMLLMMLESHSSGTIAIFDRTSIMRAKADLLEKNTKMIDYLKEVREEIGDATDKYDAQKDEVIKELRTQSEFFEKLTDLFSDPEFQAQTRTMRASSQVLELLISTHGYEESIVDDIYKYAKFNYDIGNYELALEWLGRFIQLAPQNHSHSLDAVWGRLAAAICSEQFEVAHEAMVQLRDNIDQTSGREGGPSALQLLQQRTWLLHWSLFIFFNGLSRGKELLIELFLHNADYTHAIQTMAPWLLRYLTAAVVLSINSRKRKTIERDLVKIIEQEEYAYKDPITEFILCLYVKFDFQKAQVYLEECEKVLENDFFLRNYTKEFIENARQIIFETFCRIHQCISISRLAEKLNMNEKEAERWIVNLIKNARLDAKIDTKRGHVVMSDHATNAHQQVIEKTKHLQFRTSLLSTFIDRRMGKEKGSDVPQWAMKDNRNKGKNNGERRSQWRSHQQ